MQSSDKKVSIEIGAIIEGFVCLFPELVQYANQMMASCENLIQNSPYGTINNLSVFTNTLADNDSARAQRSIYINTDQSSHVTKICELDGFDTCIKHDLHYAYQEITDYPLTIQ